MSRSPSPRKQSANKAAANKTAANKPISPNWVNLGPTSAKAMAISPLSNFENVNANENVQKMRTLRNELNKIIRRHNTAKKSGINTTTLPIFRTHKLDPNDTFSNRELVHQLRVHIGENLSKLTKEQRTHVFCYYILFLGNMSKEKQLRYIRMFAREFTKRVPYSKQQLETMKDICLIGTHP